MTNEGTQGKSKAIWDPRTHEIWVDLAIEQKYPEASKFCVKGLEHAFKLDELFRDVTAIGARAWAPTSGIMPHLYTQASNIEGNIDEINSLDSEEANREEEVECSNRNERRLEPNRKKFEKGKRNNSATSKLSNQLEELCESIKSRSSYLRTDPPGCSVQEVDKLTTLPECEPMSPLFKLGITLFTKKANREIFVAVREPEYQIQWLKDHQN
ncbi:hypothetical protein ACOSP7_023831 [Xanthoceras sorbifolium]